MTNYNERLNRVLSDYAEAMGSYANFGSPFNSDEDNIAGAEALYQTSQNEAKQAITSLIKELLAEAKPEYVSKTSRLYFQANSNGAKAHMNGYRLGIREYEQNLLKALEEV